jgi:hypothetical protein
LRRDLAGVGLAWLRGGNVFMLLFALFRGAGDIVFRDLLAADALVCAGYSAGGCVLSSTLRGLEAVDDVGAVMRIYGSEPAWDGLALFKEAFALRRARPAAAAGSCRGKTRFPLVRPGERPPLPGVGHAPTVAGVVLKYWFVLMAKTPVSAGRHSRERLPWRGQPRPVRPYEKTSSAAGGKRRRQR